MKTKNFTPLLLLVAGMFTMLACSKQENVKGTGKGLQTDARNAQGSVKDSLIGTWYLRTAQLITIDHDKHDQADTTTLSYEKAEYIVKYYENGTGMEMLKKLESKEYVNIPFTYEETAQHHIFMREESPGYLNYDFEVYFPDRSSDRVRLTQIIDGKHVTKKTIWDMEHAQVVVRPK